MSRLEPRWKSDRLQERFYKTVAHNIKQQRQQLNLPQKDIDKFLRLSTGATCAIENCRRRIYFHHVEAFAAAFDCSVDELLGW